jgi:hypothetical protein
MDHLDLSTLHNRPPQKTGNSTFARKDAAAGRSTTIPVTRLTGEHVTAISNSKYGPSAEF